MNALFYKVLGSGILLMFMGIGIARFSFTPVLPLMQVAFGLSDTVSGALASANYLGYLLGSLYCIRKRPDADRMFIRFLTALGANILCVGVMWVESVWLWHAARLASGFASAVAFILGSEFILAWLNRQGKERYFSVIYSGVGLGMVISGLCVPMLSGHVPPSGIWLFLTALMVAPAFFAAWFIPVPETAAHRSPDTSQHPKKTSRPLKFLALAYFLEGLGYVVTGTFISVMVLRGTGSMVLSGYAWVIAGAGALVITPAWSMVAARHGLANTLALVYLVQGMAIAVPVLWPGIPGTVLGALGYGGTFVGIAALTIAYGKKLDSTVNTTALLTFYFSIGQAAGPFAAGLMSDISGGFALPVLAAAALVFLGSSIIFLTKENPHALHQHQNDPGRRPAHNPTETGPDRRRHRPVFKCHGQKRQNSGCHH